MRAKNKDSVKNRSRSSRDSTLTKLMVLSLILSAFFTGFGIPAHADSTSTASQGLTRGGVCICFDDEYVDDWYSIRPILQKYNAKATFFLTDFDQYTPAQYQEIATLQSDGDEMGCHTLRHLDAVQYLSTHTMDQYIATEITPAIAAMDAKGIHPTDFAYPYGSYNDALDTALLKIFDHVRIISDYDDPLSPNDPSIPMAFYNFNNEKVLGAIGMDNIFNIPLQDYYNLMNQAKASNSVVVFYGHETIESTASDYITPPSRLDTILKYASDNGLTFYTMNQLQTGSQPPAQTSAVVNLNANWTFMSLPLLNTTLMASQLGSSGVTRVASYNSTTNGYNTYVTGYSATDMQILPDKAYFVDSGSSTSFKLYGTAEGSHNIGLSPGWNAVGWCNQSTVKASDICSRLGDIQRICRYNTATNAYDTYVAGFSDTGSNFNIQPGEGYFIYLNSTANEQLKIGGN